MISKQRWIILGLVVLLCIPTLNIFAKEIRNDYSIDVHPSSYGLNGLVINVDTGEEFSGIQEAIDDVEAKTDCDRSDRLLLALHP